MRRRWIGMPQWSVGAHTDSVHCTIAGSYQKEAKMVLMGEGKSFR